MGVGLGGAILAYILHRRQTLTLQDTFGSMPSQVQNHAEYPWVSLPEKLIDPRNDETPAV
jgi:hypothetical protein